MKKWKKIAIAVGVVAVLGIVAAVSVKMSRKGIVTVQTGKVMRQDLVSLVTASGEVKPLSYVNVGATAFGKITEIAVKEGDRVTRGQLLARLEAVQSSADVAAQRAALRVTEGDALAAEASSKSAEAASRTAVADLNRARAEMEKNRLEFERAQQLYRDQLISKSQFDAAKAAFEVGEAVVAQSEARVAQNRAQAEQARSQQQSARTRIQQSQATLTRVSDALSKHTFLSPLNGVVTNLPVEVGETVVVGIQNSPGSLLMTIADMSVITAEVKVDETDIVNVQLGQTADVTIDAIPNKTFKGEVTEIGNTAVIRSTGVATSSSNIASQEAKDFKVVITLKDPPQNLRPGLSTTAKIQTAARKNVLSIPIQALTIRQKGDLEKTDKKSDSSAALAAGPASKEKEKEAKKEIQGVFAVRGGKVVFVPVETGITGTTDIEVTSGLKENDEIVTGSYRVLRTIRNDATVKVDNKAPKKEDDAK